MWLMLLREQAARVHELGTWHRKAWIRRLRSCRSTRLRLVLDRMLGERAEDIGQSLPYIAAPSAYTGRSYCY